MRRLVTYTALIGAVAVATAIWATASEPDKPAAVAAPVGALRAGPAPPVAKTPPPATGRRQTAMPGPYYLIECQLLDTGPDGQTRVLSHPVLMTLEGQPAVIRVGGEVPLPKAAPVTGGPFKGLLLEVKVCRTEGGQTFLDANFQRSWTPSEPKPDSVRLLTVGVRIIEPVRLGQKISVPLGPDGVQTTSRRFEIVVRDAANKRVAPIAGKPLRQPARPATRPGASPTVR
jgi:hypothetical protein